MAAVDDRDSVQWRRRWCCSMWPQQRSTVFDVAAAAFDGVRWHRRWTTTRRGREGSARMTGNATTSQHDERTRGRCNERTTRDDGATTSWRNETTRDGTTRLRDGERAAQREATQQPADATRGREAARGATRGRGEAIRQQAGTTS
jgi:hypothetical protein